MAQVVERFVRDEEAASSSLVTPIDRAAVSGFLKRQLNYIYRTGVKLLGNTAGRLNEKETMDNFLFAGGDNEYFGMVPP